MNVEHGFLALLETSSPCMRQVAAQIRQVAATEIPVLVTGESGTGKELAARAIHENSPRAGGPYVPLHTGAVPRELVASELFGHEKGAFTGATRDKPGCFELARGGTMFLDEIATMDVQTQVSLLRLLESRRCQRVGGTDFVQLDFRLVAATNVNLQQAVEQGSFRTDLYHRLSVYEIHLPPLRERQAEIPQLAGRLLDHYAALFGKRAPLLPAESQELLRSYSWPGNVRELENVIQKALILATGGELTPECLSLGSALVDPEEPIVLPVGTSLGEVERLLIDRTLQRVHGNKQRAAEILGISRKGIYNKLLRYGIGA
jgi:DNA-binding NtrC family response regulator